VQAKPSINFDLNVASVIKVYIQIFSFPYINSKFPTSFME